jgi:hypothetical protein
VGGGHECHGARSCGFGRGRGEAPTSGAPLCIHAHSKGGEEVREREGRRGGSGGQRPWWEADDYRWETHLTGGSHLSATRREGKVEWTFDAYWARKGDGAEGS